MSSSYQVAIYLEERHPAAVIFLIDFLPFSSRIQAICLPTEDHSSLPENMLNFGITTVGWGRDDEDNIGNDRRYMYITTCCLFLSPQSLPILWLVISES